MSRRTSIIQSLATILQTIDGTGKFTTNIYGAAYPTLKFWDEVSNFPSIYIVAGTETREYHPGNFTWGYLNVSLKVYTKGQDASDQLEDLLEDIETVINANRPLIYNSSTGEHATETLVTSIVTDEGLLAPYSIAEVNLQIRYQII